ncbi:2-hydroxyacid dehydrogenase [Brackiella oedipodis]|uniref:2-hydroxyacid dehydrogenase n=1 Tax=Brackiella oedipodis TaxID=124225 RepID=UPI00048FA99F|nr:2-hydroxyacid dehydrogenase [Brackiella oedipodis]
MPNTIHTVLVLAPLFETIQQALEQDYHVIFAKPKQLSGLSAEQLQSVDAIVSFSGIEVSQAQYEALPNLQLIANVGVGFDNYDLEYLRSRRIALSNTPEVLNDCVADAAIALWLALSRDIVKADSFVRQGQWSQPYPYQTAAHHKKVGILGLGSIGADIAKRVQAFDCEIGYHNRHQRDDVDYQYFAEARDLAQWADFLFVATVGGATTANLVNAEVLEALGPKGFLINIARGSVIDEAALLQALQTHRIAGAGLDVFQNEPRINPAFFALDNTVLTPHIASATQETRLAMQQLSLDNLRKFSQHQQLITPVIDVFE